MSRNAGFLARFDSTCGRCGHEIARAKDTVVKRGDIYIHTSCASGQDEE